MHDTILHTLSKELNIQAWQAESLARLMDEGNTTPFIARYRKEQHGNMDDQAIRLFAERLGYLRALDKRRAEVVAALQEQGALNDALRGAIEACGTQSALEELYKPYRLKRRTRASIAKEKGLEPLADALLEQQPKGPAPVALASPFIDPSKGVESADEALKGAMDIIAERLSLEPAVRASLTELYAREGALSIRAVGEGDAVYRDYYDTTAQVRGLPAHRVLAINRGEAEGALKVNMDAPDARARSIVKGACVKPGSPSTPIVEEAADDAYDRLLAPSITNAVRAEMTERAQEAALRVFALNLHNLLLQPPVRGRVTLGLDPGIRTGCKCAVVSATGAVLETGVIYPLPAQGRVREAEAAVKRLIARHGVTLIAIGNGTASRETAAFVAQLLRGGDGGIQYAMVSEAGASVYSASALAAEEFPGMDVSLRSAVSIARRVQDPLAELIKIDPKSIGVGQYQHDLKEARLDEALGGVVEDCVNSVGVDLNTASAQLLKHVAGIGPVLARNIVEYREEIGAFAGRAQLKKVKKLGPKAFEQCAGFLRVAGGGEPLDATGVHPESYAAARKLLHLADCESAELPRGLPDLMERVNALGVADTAAAIGVGQPTLLDIVRELQKPGRDPRDELPPPLLRDDILSIEDLKPGMRLQGTVRNVTDFGAFVDIGVHQDGLLHVSQLQRRVRHPSEALKVGDIISVQVLSCDIERGRIALSMRAEG